MDRFTIRPPRAADAPRLADIYNWAVRHTAATMDEQERPAEYYAGFVLGDALHRLLVAEAAGVEAVAEVRTRMREGDGEDTSAESGMREGDGGEDTSAMTTTTTTTTTMTMTMTTATLHTVIGYAAVGPFSPRPGYREFAELALYVHPDWQGRGVGARLLAELHRGEGDGDTTGGGGDDKDDGITGGNDGGHDEDDSNTGSNGGGHDDGNDGNAGGQRSAHLRGLHAVLAKVNADNAGARRLLERFGYRCVGELAEAGLKFGRRQSIALYQRFV